MEEISVKEWSRRIAELKMKRVRAQTELEHLKTQLESKRKEIATLYEEVKAKYGINSIEDLQGKIKEIENYLSVELKVMEEKVS